MTPKIFDNNNVKDTNEYFKWMTEHPEGFVVDLNKKDKDDKYIYHKSDCNHIASHTCSYINRGKIGFADVDELTEWLAGRKPDVVKGSVVEKACSLLLVKSSSYLSFNHCKVPVVYTTDKKKQHATEICFYHLYFSGHDAYFVRAEEYRLKSKI